MAEYPGKLNDFIETFEMFPDRETRMQLLLDCADRFHEVPSHIAQRPFPESHRVPYCESEAFVWAVNQPDRAIKLYFAVENPQGISAKALATILDESLSGYPANAAASVPTDLAYKIFGRELTMGKGMGLTGMVQMVQAQAKRLLANE